MRTKTGPKTFVPAEPILGGQLVEARAAGRVGVAAADSAKVLGVAVVDGIAPEAQVTTPVDVGGRSVLNTAVLPAAVSVAYGGIEVPVRYSGAAAFGDRLKAAAGGTVVAAGATPDARLVVGICTEPLGVASGATGLMRTA
ncbi:hypothetical protein [Pseudokineococcus marinus]|nr:hypothetical protein [Pseudokineococcus marinus]